MRVCWMSAICLALLTHLAVAGEAISPKTLAAIKRATVFVKVDSKGHAASGSGFVVKVDGETALIVTNHHVIEPKVKIEASPVCFQYVHASEIGYASESSSNFCSNWR